jgi:hypothetical protein
MTLCYDRTLIESIVLLYWMCSMVNGVVEIAN